MESNTTICQFLCNESLYLRLPESREILTQDVDNEPPGDLLFSQACAVSRIFTNQSKLQRSWTLLTLPLASAILIPIYTVVSLLESVVYAVLSVIALLFSSTYDEPLHFFTEQLTTSLYTSLVGVIDFIVIQPLFFIATLYPEETITWVCRKCSYVVEYIEDEEIDPFAGPITCKIAKEARDTFEVTLDMSCDEALEKAKTVYRKEVLVKHPDKGGNLDEFHLYQRYYEIVKLQYAL